MMGGRLTFYLGLSNLMWFISILAGVSDVDSTSDSVCRIAGPLNQVFALTSIFWTTCVALHMALIITKVRAVVRSNHLTRRSSLIGFWWRTLGSS